MIEKFTCTQARGIDLVEYLETLGHSPQRISRSEYWYLSPLREERTASFKVDRKLNLWYDHGIGKGGTLIDFGILYFSCPVSELLQRLSVSRPTRFTFQEPLVYPKPKEQEGKIRIISASEITSSILRKYLAARKIDEKLASRYCKQIFFTLYGKTYIAIGFPNNSGGYELRNQYFKGSCAPKDITLIDRSRKTISVFEGFFNFLSWVQLHGKKGIESSFLVLNTVSFFERSVPVMEQYSNIHLYLDRDAAGRKATQKALSTSRKYKDKSYLYQHHNDLNEFLMNGNRNNLHAV